MLGSISLSPPQSHRIEFVVLAMVIQRIRISPGKINATQCRRLVLQASTKHLLLPQPVILFARAARRYIINQAEIYNVCRVQQHARRDTTLCLAEPIHLEVYLMLHACHALLVSTKAQLMDHYHATLFHLHVPMESSFLRLVLPSSISHAATAQCVR